MKKPRTSLKNIFKWPKRVGKAILKAYLQEKKLRFIIEEKKQSGARFVIFIALPEEYFNQRLEQLSKSRQSLSGYLEPTKYVKEKIYPLIKGINDSNNLKTGKFGETTDGKFRIPVSKKI
jgi:hypothetical protein